MTNEEALKHNNTCREKVTIEIAIERCERGIGRAEEEKAYADGKVDAYTNMLNTLKMLKEDWSNDND